MDWIDIAVALIASLPGIIALRNAKKRDNADAAESISQAASKLIEGYGARMSDIEKELADVRKENAALRKERDEQNRKIACLEAQVDKQDKTIGLQKAEMEKMRDIIESQSQMLKDLQSSPASGG